MTYEYDPRSDTKNYAAGALRVGLERNRPGCSFRFALRAQRQAGRLRSSLLGSCHFVDRSADRTERPAETKREFCIFQFPLFVLGVLLFIVCPSSQAQTVTDKTVATVTNGSQTVPDVITYSDLIWQLALEPRRVLTTQPSSQDLNEALKTLEDQLLILQEARKLPLALTVDAQKDFEETVKKRRDELAQSFGSRVRLEERMLHVGLTSEHLDAILRDRVTMEKYLDFRFRAFALVSPKEISDRYEKEYGRLRGSERIVKPLEEVRDQIEHDVTEDKIAEEIDKFVDNLREQPGTEIVILNPV
jgi:hypothetical protein